MQKFRPAAAAVIAVCALSLGACATKKFVTEQVGVVDTKVAATQSQADETKAGLATQGSTLQQHDTRLAAIDQTAKDALARADAASKTAEGKFTYTAVLTDDSVKFPAAKAALSDEAKTRLMDLATKLKSDNRNVYVEVQGYTDATEARAGDMRLGQMRADAVRRFLNEQGVALNRISTISYGKDQPVASNKTRDGRAQNRRVVVVVLS